MVVVDAVKVAYDVRGESRENFTFFSKHNQRVVKGLDTECHALYNHSEFISKSSYPILDFYTFVFPYIVLFETTNSLNSMNRRDALMRVAALVGTTVSLPALADTLEASAIRRATTGKPVFFTADQDATVAELAETIIPTTKTPGAKAAKVNEIIDILVKDCYKEADQKQFLEGLAQTNKLSQDAYGKAFVQLDPAQRIEIVKKLEADAKQQRADMAKARAQNASGQQDVQMPNEKRKSATPFFTMMKDLTLTGYFTSEIGCTQALEYVAVPGRYEGCVPLKPGQKAWAI